MEVTEHNDVKVYNLAAGRSIPQWLEETKKNGGSLRYNEDFRRRIDLMQDFDFPIASSRVKQSPDGQYIVATGIYAPEVRIFETRELGLKCARGLDHEVVDFLFLSDDYRKLVFLQDDRTVELHSQYGRHHKLRVPKFGRSLGYDSETCHLLVGGSSREVIRMDLETGGFQAPIVLKNLEDVNQLAVSPLLPVVSCAGSDGLVETFDLRNSSLQLQPLKVCDEGSEVTCCAYSNSGMHFTAATSSGMVRVFDVRSSRPLAQRDMMNGYAVRSVMFHNGTGGDLLVASADSKSVKVWGANNGKMVASLEHSATINHISFCPGTGLLYVANDQPKIGCYFVPSLGVAPSWASFLDSMTEELEEKKQGTVFDDYQFVTKERLEQLGAQDLIGTKFLQPYMHGYFMDHRLHGRLKAAMEPFQFEEYRKKKVKERLEAKRTWRTRIRSKVKVNEALHSRLQVATEDAALEGSSQKKKASGGTAKKLLSDDRFRALFEDEDFKIEAEGARSNLADAMPELLKRAGLGGKKRKLKR